MTLAQLRTRLPDRLATARLALRAPGRGDIGAIAALANDRAIHAMTAALPFPYERTHAETFVERLARTEAEWAYGIALRDGPLVGVIGLHTDRDPWEIGYWIGQPFWGRGYASEAAAALVAAALEIVPALNARARRENATSRAVLEKTGFRLVGERLEDCGQNEQIAMVHYRLGREDAR